MDETPDRPESRSNLPDGQQEPPAGQPDRPAEGTRSIGPGQGRSGWVPVASNTLPAVMAATAGGISANSLVIGIAVFAVVTVVLALVIWTINSRQR